MRQLLHTFPKTEIDAFILSQLGAIWPVRWRALPAELGMRDAH